MVWNLENKIYIPEDFENTLFERLPFSKGLLLFLRSNKIHYIKDLRQITLDVIEQIVGSSEKPFPELRRFIIQIQKSPTNQVILEQKVDSKSIVDENNEQEQTNEIISIPENLMQLPISYLIPSSRMANVFKQLNVSSLKDLHGMDYKKTVQVPRFGKTLLSELQGLIKFIQMFQSVDDFESILFASIKRKKAEELTKKTFNQEKVKTSSILPKRITRKSKSKSSEKKIFIPILLKGIPFSKFPISIKLEHTLKIKKIILLGNLEKYSYDQLKQTLNCGNETISELQYFIEQIQEDKIPIGERTNDSLYKWASELTLIKLMNFINRFLEQISSIEKEILLDRFGGSNNDRVLKFEEIAKKHQTTKEAVAQKFSKVYQKLKNRIGQSANSLMEKLKNDCLEAVCPLTPQFLVYLTDDEYNLFLYPPTFYVRLIGKLSPEIPILPEYENKITFLNERTGKIAEQIKTFLKASSFPASLPEVFSYVTSSSLTEKDSAKLFLESIQSARFNLIKTNNPKEMFIELCEKDKF